jgi:hypothetical protein
LFVRERVFGVRFGPVELDLQWLQWRRVHILFCQLGCERRVRFKQRRGLLFGSDNEFLQRGLRFRSVRFRAVVVVLQWKLRRHERELLGVAQG